MKYCKSRPGMKMRVALNMELLVPTLDPLFIIIAIFWPLILDVQILNSDWSKLCFHPCHWLPGYHTISKEAGKHAKVSFCRIFTHWTHWHTYLSTWLDAVIWKTLEISLFYYLFSIIQQEPFVIETFQTHFISKEEARKVQWCSSPALC